MEDTSRSDPFNLFNVERVVRGLETLPALALNAPVVTPRLRSELGTNPWAAVRES